MALLSKWTFEAKGPSSQKSASNRNAKGIPPKREGTFLQRIKFGFDSMCSFRDIGTSYEVKGVPPFSSKDPKYVPTRKRILLKSTLKFCICYLVIDIIESLPKPPNATALYAAKNIPVFTRLDEISLEEIIRRMVGSAVLWVVLYCALNILQALLCIIFVGSRLDGVEQWRPLMGPLSEAYTVRGFWGYVSLMPSMAKGKLTRNQNILAPRNSKGLRVSSELFHRYYTLPPKRNTCLSLFQDRPNVFYLWDAASPL
jgi:hypothetical protein